MAFFKKSAAQAAAAPAPAPVKRVLTKEQKKQRIRYKIRNKAWPTLVMIFKYLLLIELAFTILYPLFAQLATTFMNKTDLVDSTVEYFAKTPSFKNYKTLANLFGYGEQLINSFGLCLLTAILTTFSAAFCGYGLAKFKFKGRTFLFAIVILTIIIPPQTVMLSLYTKFHYFDFFGLFQSMGFEPINLVGSYLPAAILSVTGFGFRGGLFIFLMRQFYNGVPRELMEAAYVDGASVYRTYFSVILPLGRTLMITVFLLAFSWMWTDTFYANILYPGVNIVSGLVSSARYELTSLGITSGTKQASMYMNTATMMILFPLLAVFIVGQKFMVEGIESSGIVG